MFDRIRYWLPLGFAITVIFGTIYLTGQQILRMGANDPQIQISEDLARRFAESTPIPTFPNSSTIDIGKSLSTFVMIFDNQGKTIYSNARLDGKTPVVPQGVFDYTRKHTQSRITWQPRTGIRNAIIVTKFDGKSKGFVLSGRSLRETEIREDNLIQQVGLGWIVAMLGSLLAKTIFISKKKAISIKSKTKK